LITDESKVVEIIERGGEQNGFVFHVALCINVCVGVSMYDCACMCVTVGGCGYVTYVPRRRRVGGWVYICMCAVFWHFESVRV
jgi:hypothetical protein